MPPFNVTLTNTEAVDYSAFAGVDVEVACTLKPAAYTVNGTCPGGAAYAAQCPAKAEGTVTIDCMGSQLVPRCLVLQSGEYEVSSSCILAAYTATTTTCSCAFPDRRRLSSVEGSAQVSSATTVLAGDVGGQVFTPTRETSNSNNRVIGAGVLAGIIVAALVLCGGLGYVSYHHRSHTQHLKAVTPGPGAADEEASAGNRARAGSGAGARWKEQAEDIVNAWEPLPESASAPMQSASECDSDSPVNAEREAADVETAEADREAAQEKAARAGLQWQTEMQRQEEGEAGAVEGEAGAEEGEAGADEPAYLHRNNDPLHVGEGDVMRALSG
ncbi:hypothetical protein B484DRAFT_452445, partial [Ochromonadaceae sp. CCMP2298]